MELSVLTKHYISTYHCWLTKPHQRHDCAQRLPPRRLNRRSMGTWLTISVLKSVCLAGVGGARVVRVFARLLSVLARRDRPRGGLRPCRMPRQQPLDFLMLQPFVDHVMTSFRYCAATNSAIARTVVPGKRALVSNLFRWRPLR